MKANIVCVGKIKESYFADAVGEYVKRCSRFGGLNIIEVPEAPQGKPVEQQKEIESAALMQKAKGYKIAMDFRGRQLDSEGLAALLDELAIKGYGEVSFLVGGSNGHSDALRDGADMVLSMGNYTFPHQLFRVMLAEQIYRAMTINAGVKYHK